MLRLQRLVFLALLVETLHKSFEFGQLLGCKDGANARPTLLPEFLTLRIRWNIGGVDFRSRVIYDHAQLLLLVGREL